MRCYWTVLVKPVLAIARRSRTVLRFNETFRLISDWIRYLCGIQSTDDKHGKGARQALDALTKPPINTIRIVFLFSLSCVVPRYSRQSVLQLAEQLAQVAQ